MERGARGSVSALATAFPELVGAAVRDPSSDRSAQLAELRDGLEAFPRHAALKRILGLRGVAVREDVCPPLRGLIDEERRALDTCGETSGRREPTSSSEEEDPPRATVSTLQPAPSSPAGGKPAPASTPSPPRVPTTSASRAAPCASQSPARSRASRPAAKVAHGPRLPRAIASCAAGKFAAVRRKSVGLASPAGGGPARNSLRAARGPPSAARRIASRRGGSRGEASPARRATSSPTLVARASAGASLRR